MTQTHLQGSLLGIHALTGLHPGSGSALGSVDLPVQRERHTQWPTIGGSALKGILRDACREKISLQTDLGSLEQLKEEDSQKEIDPKDRRKVANSTLHLNEMFGTQSGGATEFAGAVSVTDARVLAYPVRSAKGVFVWVTCKSVLDRLKRDADMIGLSCPFTIPKLQQETGCCAIDQSPCLLKDKLILEEYEFTKEVGDVSLVSDWIATQLLPTGEKYEATRTQFKKQLVLLSDDYFTHFVRYATEISARIALDYETKTAKKRALFYQEFLPTETLLYSVIVSNASRSGKNTLAGSGVLLKRLRDFLPAVLQIGGDETTGKGYCSVRMTGGN